MNTRDLQIGDLVYNHRLWVCPVVEILKDSVTVIAKHYGESTYRINDISPIEITPEILLNSGFRLVDAYSDVYENKTSRIIRVIKTSDGKWSISTTNVTDINIKYIHEFQHVLRISGIEKLFNINEEQYLFNLPSQVK